MRWIVTLILSMLLVSVTGCVLSTDDGTPDTTIVDTNPPASSTTVIEHDDTPAPDADVDVNVDTTK
jgi:hypothetical protein